MKPVASLALALAALTLLPTAHAELPTPTPEWIHATYDEGTQSLWLTWADVAGATSYNVYRDDALVATLNSPGFLDAIPTVSTVLYRVTAVSASGESVPAVVSWTQIDAINLSILGTIGEVELGFNGDPCSPIVLGSPDWPYLFQIDSGCIDGLIHRP